MDEEEFDKFLFEKWESNRNKIFDEITALAEARVSSGAVVPATVAALVPDAARHLAQRHETSVGKGFFEACVTDILEDGDGLHVNRKRGGSA